MSTSTDSIETGRVRRLDRDATIPMLPGATEFTDDRALVDPASVIELLQRHPQVWEPVSQALRAPRAPSGPARMPGDWGLIYLAFVLSGNVDVEPFYNTFHAHKVWELAGFSGVPSYQTTYERFTELEAHAARFQEAAQELVERAARHEPRIGDYIYTDATAYHTNARLEHCCHVVGGCPDCRGPKPVRFPTRAEDSQVQDERARAAALPPEHIDLAGEIGVDPETGDLLLPDALAAAAEDDDNDDDDDHDDRRRAADPGSADGGGASSGATRRRRGPKKPKKRGRLAITRLKPEHTAFWSNVTGLAADHPDAPYSYWVQNGHLYRMRDQDAGVRTYRDPTGRTIKCWFGGHHLTASDYFTGAPVAVLQLPADTQEYDGYEPLLDHAITATGKTPLIVGGDRGYSVKKVIDYNNRRAIGSAFPFRASNMGLPTQAYLDTDHHDRHGIPRCRHCGAPGSTRGSGLGFVITSRGEPRIRYRCAIGLTSDCATAVQSIDCDSGWRVLGRIGPADRIFHNALAVGKSLEHTHRNWRARYKVAGNSLHTRPKRVGMGTVSLRATAALFIEWFRICLRHGWLGNHKRRNRNQPHARHTGMGQYNDMLAERRDCALDLPYGHAALEAGLAADATRPPLIAHGPRRAPTRAGPYRGDPPPG
jgi:hypothetical protein